MFIAAVSVQVSLPVHSTYMSSAAGLSCCVVGPYWHAMNRADSTESARLNMEIEVE